MRITTGLVFAIYTTALVLFGKTVDSRALTSIPHIGDYYPIEFEAANADEYSPRAVIAYRSPSAYHAYPWDASNSRAKRTELNERGRRGALSIGEHMARLRRGSVNFGEQMARLRRAALMGEDMARL